MNIELFERMQQTDSSLTPGVQVRSLRIITSQISITCFSKKIVNCTMPYNIP